MQLPASSNIGQADVKPKGLAMESKQYDESNSDQISSLKRGTKVVCLEDDNQKNATTFKSLHHQVSDEEDVSIEASSQLTDI
jgi:hypothetical protein